MLRGKLDLIAVRCVRMCHTFSDLNNMRIVKSLSKPVDPNSSINLETPIDVKIQPSDQNDTILLEMYSKLESSTSNFQIKQSTKRVDLIGDSQSTDSVCLIKAPLNSSFNIKCLGDSNVFIEGMQSENCRFTTSKGYIKIKDFKGKNIDANSVNGYITCQGTIWAESVNLKTETNGDIDCQHLRTSQLKITTNEGDISTNSCYSDKSHFITVTGSLKLNNLHSKCNIEVLERGDLSITGFDGNIHSILKRGNVYLQASKLIEKNSIFVHESGLVEVNLTDIKDMNLVELIAKKLNIEDKVLELGRIVDDQQHQKYRFEKENVGENDSNELYVECRNGSVEIKISSWKDMLIRKGIEIDKL